MIDPNPIPVNTQVRVRDGDQWGKEGIVIDYRPKHFGVAFSVTGANTPAITGFDYKIRLADGAEAWFSSTDIERRANKA